MEIRINIHAQNPDFELAVNGQKLKTAYDSTRKAYFAYADVHDIQDFEIAIASREKKSMTTIGLCISIMLLFWFFLFLEIMGMGEDGNDWKKEVYPYRYRALFHVHNLKDQEVNIRYEGNSYQKTNWLKPKFAIADEADLKLYYVLDQNALEYGYQKYWQFYGSLSMCVLVLAAFLLYVIVTRLTGIFLSLVLTFAILILIVVFIMNNIRIMKDYRHQRACFQAEGAHEQLYEEHFE